MQTNSHHRLSPSRFAEYELCCVTKLVANVLESSQAEITKRKLHIELDLQPINAHVQPVLIRAALKGLLINAIHSSPVGGDLAITSIDSTYQWEIEFADSSGTHPTARPESPERTPEMSLGLFERSPVIQNRFDVDAPACDDLPRILPFQATEHLRSAYRAAWQHEGQIQTWSCPQGGLAYVLFIPKRTLAQSA